VVPVGFSIDGVGVPDGEPALSGPGPGVRAKLLLFCFSRASRRSLLRCRRASSALTLSCVLAMFLLAQKNNAYLISFSLSSSGFPEGVAS